MFIHMANYHLKSVFIFIIAMCLHYLDKIALKSKYWKTTPSPLLTSLYCNFKLWYFWRFSLSVLSNMLLCFFPWYIKFSSSSLTLPLLWSLQPPKMIILQFFCLNWYNVYIVMLLELVMSSLTYSLLSFLTYNLLSSLELTCALKTLLTLWGR